MKLGWFRKILGAPQSVFQKRSKNIEKAKAVLTAALLMSAVACDGPLDIPFLSDDEDGGSVPGGGGGGDGGGNEEPDEPASPASLQIKDPDDSDAEEYNFGSRIKNNDYEKTLSLQNSGESSATEMLNANLTPPFSFKGGQFPGTGGSCASELAAGSSCDIVVQFAPSGDDSYRDQVAIRYNDSSEVRSTSFVVKGEGRDRCGKVIVSSETTFSPLNAGLNSSDSWRGQRLRFTERHHLKRIRLQLRRSTNADMNSVVVEFRQECDQRGAGLPSMKPCDEALVTLTKPHASIPTDYELILFELDQALVLNPETYYYFVINYPGITEGTGYVKATSVNMYSNGSYHYTNDDGATWKLTSDVDLQFRLYECAD